ncbi:DUF4148 domain-containing protein [Variovorax sp. H27-G14]|uniref:DUF4148 domain-containing protein n=1 Tax=Variovorax sp. H27-G14 TaxID=3111914 RepID=UPI0038FC53FB
MIKLNATMFIGSSVLALLASAASAQGLTRDQVKAQLAAAEASGQMNALYGEDSGSAYLSSHFHSTEPRSEVKAEVQTARANGTLAALDGADSGSAYLSSHLKLTEPRSEVKAQLAAAEKNGTLDALYGEDSGSFELAAGKAAQSQKPVVAAR